MKKPRAIVIRFNLDDSQKRALRNEAKKLHAAGLLVRPGLRDILRHYGTSKLC